MPRLTFHRPGQTLLYMRRDTIVSSLSAWRYALFRVPESPTHRFFHPPWRSRIDCALQRTDLTSLFPRATSLASWLSLVAGKKGSGLPDLSMLAFSQLYRRCSPTALTQFESNGLFCVALPLQTLGHRWRSSVLFASPSWFRTLFCHHTIDGTGVQPR